MHAELHTGGTAEHVVVKAEVQTAGRTGGRTSDFSLGSGQGRRGIHQHIPARCTWEITTATVVICMLNVPKSQTFSPEFSAMLKTVAKEVSII